MRRGLGFALALFAAAAGGAGLGWQAHVPKHDVAAYAVSRLVAIRQHLDEAEPGFVLIAGDSQAELQSPSLRICGTPVVNAGVSGATAAVYAGLLKELEFPVRAGTAVLTIGTNDLVSKKNPLASEATDRFEHEVGDIVARLKAVSDRVVVTALPPLGRETVGELEADAVGPYSRRLRDLCARIGCLYADPFAELRDGDTGFGLPGVNRNGLHLARYRSVPRNLTAALCPAAAGAR